MKGESRRGKIKVSGKLAEISGINDRLDRGINEIEQKFEAPRRILI